MRRSSAVLAASVLAVSLISAPSALGQPVSLATAPSAAADHRAGGNPNSPEKLVRSISSANLEKDIHALADIAEEHGNRAAGTPGYDASVEYAVSELEKAGYHVELQEFEITYTQTLRAELTQHTPEEQDLAHAVFT